jgi:hypothetical protein
LAGFLVLRGGSFVIFSGFHRLAHRGSRVFRIPLSARELRKARAAAAGGHAVYAVLSGIAVDGQGRPLDVSRRGVLYLR